MAVFGQAPTGVIRGTVTYQPGPIAANAAITIPEKATGAMRTLTSNNGLYSAPALRAGEHGAPSEAPGFRPSGGSAGRDAGNAVTVDLQVAPGRANELVAVEQAAAINFESHTGAGAIAGNAIPEPPINGRSLNPATVRPGVTATTGAPAQFHSLINVEALGNRSNQQGACVSMAIDGGILKQEREGDGSASLTVSRTLSVDFDASSGVGAGGQVNPVTRSGGNQFDGGGYFLYRDHNLAAFGGLKRPHDPGAFHPNRKDLNSGRRRAAQNLFFARRNPRVWAGGPIAGGPTAGGPTKDTPPPHHPFGDTVPRHRFPTEQGVRLQTARDRMPARRSPRSISPSSSGGVQFHRGRADVWPGWRAHDANAWVPSDLGRFQALARVRF